MLTCVICGHRDEVEIVSHIRECHDGGLPRYLLFFPSCRVVSGDLLVSIENAVHFGYSDTEDKLLGLVTIEEQRLIVQNAVNQAAPRSEITTTADF